MISKLFDDLLAAQRQHSDALPPVDKWDPPLCGDMDLVIGREGQWVHQGSPIQRPALIKLFSTVLKREGDEYYLVTPVEKWRIRVEDAPFYITQVDRQERQKQQVLVFVSSTDDSIVAGADNPVWVETHSSTGEPNPYLLVRKNLHGLLSRNVFYQLAEWSKQCTIDGNDCYTIDSMGQQFVLG